jgi:drug/metabolite transporter (DMT)-like permease
VLVLITAVLVAITNIVKKHILNHEHALEQMAAESPFRLLVLIVLIPFVELPTLTEFGFILVAAMLLFFTILYRNKSYRHMPISTVSPLMNLSPIFLLLIAVTILGERLTAVQLGGIFLVMIGGYLLDLKNKNLLAPLKHAAGSKYTATVVVTLIFLSLMGSIDKYILQTVAIPSVTYLFWLYLIYCALALTTHITQYGYTPLIADIKKGGKWLFISGSISVTEIMILYHALSLPGVLITLVVPLRRTATLIETAVGGTVFGEKNLKQKIFASLVMVAGVVLIV